MTSGGCSRGKQWFGPRVNLGAGVDPALADLCFDAETSGGLLLSVPAAVMSKAQQRLRDAGALAHTVVGAFRARRGDEPLLQLA